MKYLLITLLTILLSLSGHTQTSGKTAIDNEKLRLALRLIDEGRAKTADLSVALTLSMERVNLLDERLTIKDSLIAKYFDVNVKKDSIIANYTNMGINSQAQKDILLAGVKGLESQLRSQKRKNVFTVVVGTIAVSGLFYLLVTK